MSRRRRKDGGHWVTFRVQAFCLEGNCDWAMVDKGATVGAGVHQRESGHTVRVKRTQEMTLVAVEREPSA